ncbi:MAG: haloacid dehalogenase [Lysobacterales bacterium]|nr:MAG: haloacid dehalogenase [Xanthomonadales bacterium]
MGKSLTEFNVLSFDCYGTLIDWETGIWDALQPLLARNRGGVSRAQALAGFGALEDRIERESPTLPYPQVLAAVHSALAQEHGLRTTPALDRAFGRSVGGWPAFADTAEALRCLQGRYRLAILSNVDRRSFAASNRKLGVRFDAIYTAEDIGSYKPAAANFEYLILKVGEDLGCGRDDLLHVAQSLYHDHVPARAHGLANAWIDRKQLSRGGAWGATASATASVAASVVEQPPVDFQFTSMAALAAAAQAAFVAAAQ